MNSIVIYAKTYGDFKSNPDIRFQRQARDIIFKKIQDEIALALATTDSHRNTLHESLYLLILSKELGPHLLAPEVVKSYCKEWVAYNLRIILMYYFMQTTSVCDTQNFIERNFEKISVCSNRSV